MGSRGTRESAGMGLMTWAHSQPSRSTAAREQRQRRKESEGGTEHRGRSSDGAERIRATQRENIKRGGERGTARERNRQKGKGPGNSRKHSWKDGKGEGGEGFRGGNRGEERRGETDRFIRDDAGEQGARELGRGDGRGWQKYPDISIGYLGRFWQD